MKKHLKKPEITKPQLEFRQYCEYYHVIHSTFKTDEWGAFFLIYKEYNQPRLQSQETNQMPKSQLVFSTIYKTLATSYTFKKTKKVPKPPQLRKHIRTKTLAVTHQHSIVSTAFEI